MEELGVTAPLSGSWWSQFIGEGDLMKIEHSGKLTLLMDILRQCELIGDKVLVFSQSLVSLDLIEEFLAAENQLNEENNAILGKDVRIFIFFLITPKRIFPRLFKYFRFHLEAGSTMQTISDWMGRLLLNCEGIGAIFSTTHPIIALVYSLFPHVLGAWE